MSTAATPNPLNPQAEVQQGQEVEQPEPKRKRGRPRKDDPDRLEDEMRVDLPVHAKQALERQDPEVYAKLGLLELALRSNAGIDVIERLAALQERAQVKAAETEFNEALSRVQAKIGRIAADSTNPATRSQFASYAALDREVRPAYTEEGFCLSFDSGLAPAPEMVRVVCYVSRGAFTRTYTCPPMPADGKGPQGAAVMSKTHATGSALTYAQRYLLKLIFNLAIGDDDDDGNSAAGMTSSPPAAPSPDNSQFRKEAITSINESKSLDDLKGRWQTVRRMALSLNDPALVDEIDRTKEAKKEALLAARPGN